MANCAIKTRPRRAFGKRPPAPQKTEGKPGRPFAEARGGGPAHWVLWFCAIKQIGSSKTTPPRHPRSPYPQHSNGKSHMMALGDRRSERTTAGSALGSARGRHPRLGLAVRCGGLSRYHFKKHAFLCVFHVRSQNSSLRNKRPGLSGRPPCKGVAIGVARRGGWLSDEHTFCVPPSCSDPVSHTGGPHVVSFVVDRPCACVLAGVRVRVLLTIR